MVIIEMVNIIEIVVVSEIYPPALHFTNMVYL